VSVRCKEIVKLLSCEASPHNNAWEMSAKRKEMVTSHAKNDSPEKWRADCWRNIPISLTIVDRDWRVRRRPAMAGIFAQGFFPGIILATSFPMTCGSCSPAVPSSV
jgi:hypothetical protein